MDLSLYKSKLEWYGKRAMLGIVKRWVKSPAVPPTAIDWKRFQRILIIRQHDPLGDVLLTTPAFRAVRMAAPQAKVDLMLRPDVAPLFENDPAFGQIWRYDKSAFRRAPLAMLKFIQDLRKAQYDAVVVLNASSFSVTSAWLAYLSEAPLRVGVSGDTYGYTGFGKVFYTTEIDAPGVAMHEVQKHITALEQVGVPSAGQEQEIHVAAEPLQAIHTMLVNGGIDPMKPFVCFHPGAGKSLHRWPVERFAELNDAFREKDISTVLVVGPLEKDLEQRVLRHTKRPPATLPALPLTFLAALLQWSALVVCNDTGVLHVAAGVGTSTVAVFGPSDPAFWNPIGPSHQVVRGADGRCENVTVASVLEKALKVLK